MTSGRKLSAAEAHGWGLVSEVVEGDGLAARAAELAAQLAAMPTRGVGLTKRLFAEAAHNTLEEQLELEAELQTAATQTADFREGVAAFLEKRDAEVHRLLGGSAGAAVERPDSARLVAAGARGDRRLGRSPRSARSPGPGSRRTGTPDA